MPHNTIEIDEPIPAVVQTSLVGLMVQIAIQCLLGLGLALAYHPTVSQAHGSASSMPPILRGLHSWGCAVLMVHATVHIAIVVYRGLYRLKSPIPYWVSLMPLLLALGLQVTGNLLPMDRHGVQSANAEAAIGAQMPFVGSAVSSLMLAGSKFSEATLTRWYLAHWGLGVLSVVIVLGVVALKSRLQSAKLGYAILPVCLAVGLAILIAPATGTAATADDFGRFNALPGWYVWALHGANALSTQWFGTGWVGTGLLPGIATAWLFLLPLLAKRISDAVLKGGVLAITGVFAALGLLMGGPVAHVTGNRDPSTQVSVTPFVAAQGQDPVLAKTGRDLFASVGCSNCHGQDGLKPSFGPSLKGIGKEHPDASFYERYIKSPTSVDAQSTMPAFDSLKPDELKALAELLRFYR